MAGECLGGGRKVFEGEAEKCAAAVIKQKVPALAGGEHVTGCPHWEGASLGTHRLGQLLSPTDRQRGREPPWLQGQSCWELQVYSTAGQPFRSSRSSWARWGQLPLCMWWGVHASLGLNGYRYAMISS